MKILTISSMYHPYQFGGAESVLKTISEGFAAQGDEVRVLASVPAGEERELDQQGVSTRFVGNKNLYWPFDKAARPGWKKVLWHAKDMRNRAMASMLDKELAYFQPEVVVTHNLMGFSVAMWEVAHAHGLPIVHVLHDYALLCSRTTLFKDDQLCGGDPNLPGIDTQARCLPCRILSAPKKPVTNLVTAVVGVSQAVLDVHVQAGLFAASPIKQVINNALPDDQFNHFLERPYQSGKPLRIGFFGQLVPEKGIEVFLTALAQLGSQRHCEVLIGGKGYAAYVDELKRRFPIPGVSYLGFTRPEAFYPNVDVLVVPSLWRDSFPTVIFEAYSYGLPVIGAKRGGIPELIQEGKTGYLFNPDQPAELAAILQNLVSAPQSLAAFVPAIRERLAHFRIERQLGQYQSLYQQAIAIKQGN